MKLLPSKFKLRYSIILGVVFLFIHIGAVFCVYFTDVFWWAKIASTLCILMNLIVVISIYVLQSSSNSIGEFWFDGEGRCYLKGKSGEIISSIISYPVFVSNYLIVIIFALEDRRLKVVLPIFKDALSADDFRKLKIVLKTTAI